MNISNLKEADNVKLFGGKASNLAHMLKSGLPVPEGLAVGLNAFSKTGKLKDNIKQRLPSLLKQNKLYAVRSSALVEDAKGASWAGQFETFLNIKPEGVASKVEECHGSNKARARAYASDKGQTASFEIAVVIQEMITPEYAGVLFTKDPVSGIDRLVTEYVEGLGEELVSGRADPKRLSWFAGEHIETPFDLLQLTKLAKSVEQLFGSPQDIEWVWADNKMWVVQARPITTTQARGKAYYLGEPENMFYWGPSRAKPYYMSDFMAAVDRFFVSMDKDSVMPHPPKTLILFYEGRMVWLNNYTTYALAPIPL